MIELLQWLTLLGWLFWLIRYWGAGKRIAADVKKSAQVGVSRLDTALLVIITVATTLMVGIGLSIQLGWARSLTPISNHWLTVGSGAALVGVGMAGTFYCRNYLGRFWTAETALQPNHQIIDSGPYRYSTPPHLHSSITYVHRYSVSVFKLVDNYHCVDGNSGLRVKSG